ncbi:hypothetical protein ACTXT7_015207 [Hymenolepis weldensis]
MSRDSPAKHIDTRRYVPSFPSPLPLTLTSITQSNFLLRLLNPSLLLTRRNLLIYLPEFDHR